MLPKSILVKMLKPLLPKLEGFLTNNPNLTEGEQAKIMLDVVDGEINIIIVAIMTDSDGKVIITKVMQKMGADEL